jgi:WD40 repeat protein
VYLWESKAGGTLLKKMSGHQGYVSSLSWSPDGMLLASGSDNKEGGELFVWDILTGERVQTFVGHPGMVYALAWCRCRDGASPGGDQLISGCNDGLLRWWNVESGECVYTQEAHHGTIRSLKVSPDGKSLASCGEDGAIRIWDLTSHEHLQTLRRNRPYERLNITGIRGLNEAEIASLHALGAIEES